MTLIETNKIYLGDCIELMPQIPDKSVDLILCDLPYGILSCEWDKKLPADRLMAEYNRIIKDNAAIVLTATCKFAIELINANRKYFRYDLVWEKSMSVGFANSHRMPMRSHELILVFYKHLPPYNPQGLVELEKPVKGHKSIQDKEYAYKMSTLNKPYVQRFTNYPKSILRFPQGNNNSLHPTQKPLELFKWLVLTYTSPGGLVLDNCIGSGTTAIACVETGRRFIGMELNEQYYHIACDRVRQASVGICNSLPKVSFQHIVCKIN